MKDPRITMDDRRAAKIPEKDRCPKCEGTGNEFLFMYRKCAACDGTGIKTPLQNLSQEIEKA